MAGGFATGVGNHIQVHLGLNIINVPHAIKIPVQTALKKLWSSSKKKKTFQTPTSFRKIKFGILESITNMLKLRDSAKRNITTIAKLSIQMKQKKTKKKILIK